MHRNLPLLVNQSLGERTEASIRTRAILNAREDLLTLLRQAQEVPEFLTQLRSQHEALLAQYTVAQKEYDTAGERLHMSAASPEEMQRTVTEVNAQIAKLQSELARIDARLRRTAERALIEKGLMSPKEGEYSGGKIVGDKARLSWPAVGRISAGFYNKSYQQFFGFPHKGIDIVVSQGSAVRAAADGVVFLSRFGGAKGYSYILIGHQGGTATLYGHLSQLSVSSGQEVHRGQVIGFSGGSPGTVGAGPMTTGAHLHFEVIQNGRHVNPQSVLP
jgi:murein DD-endopeptidase MepM/ murein hydrolase activator NlpD